MYAVIETGGKQYRVEPNEELAVEKLSAAPGDTVELDRVALVEQDGDVRVGAPWVEGAKVVCRVLGHGRTRKLDVETYKPKENYHRKLGHRQAFTRLRVERIALGETRSQAAGEKEG